MWEKARDQRHQNRKRDKSHHPAELIVDLSLDYVETRIQLVEARVDPSKPRIYLLHKIPETLVELIEGAFEMG